MEPQGPAGNEHVTNQLTPELLASLATTAITRAVAPVNIVAGGCRVMLMEMGALTGNGPYMAYLL